MNSEQSDFKKVIIIILSVVLAVATMIVSFQGGLGMVGNVIVFPTLIFVYGSSGGAHQPSTVGLSVIIAFIINLLVLVSLYYWGIMKFIRAKKLKGSP